MLHVLLLALIQGPAPAKFTDIFQRKVNDTLTLVVSTGGQDIRENVHLSQLSVGLLNRGKPHKVIGGMSEFGWPEYRVTRSDDSSLVVARLQTYTSGPTAKLFIDPRKYAVIKQIDYAPDVGLAAVSDAEVSTAMDLPLELVRRLEEKRNPPAPGDSSDMPRPLRDHPLPQSTYPEFARARLDRVQDGYEEAGTSIEETPGPSQIVGSRIWFGKVFYDGEGTTGVGGLGYFDTSTSRYTLLRIPEMSDWSTSALLVEKDVVWAALVGYPEGEAYAGGLIRYDLRRGRATKFAVEEVVSRIFRYQDRLLLRTKNGAYQLRDGRLVRYRVEPNIDNRFILVTDTIPSAGTQR